MSASSTLAADNSNTYVAGNLVDNSLSTAWSEGVGNPGLGEWVRFEFGRTVTVDKIEIANGYQKDSKRFNGNPRVKTLDRSSTPTTPSPRRQPLRRHRLPVHPHRAEPPRTSSWLIKSVYPGDQWDDTSISEVRFYSAG